MKLSAVNETNYFALKENNNQGQIVTDKSEEIPINSVTSEIKNNLNTNRVSGYDLITGKILEKLPIREVVVMLKTLNNAAFWIRHAPNL